jgi:hypothetical protein
MGDRDADVRALVARALTSPATVLPAAAIAGVGLAFGLWPLYLAAGAWYGIAALQTFRDPKEARRVLERDRAPRAQIPAEPLLALTDPWIQRRYDEAVTEQQRLAEAIAASPIPTPEVEADLVGMSSDLRTLCLQTQRLSDYLATVDLDNLRERRSATRERLASASASLAPSLERTAAALDEQIRLAEGLADQRDHFDAETVALISTLGTIRAEVVRVAVSAESDASGRIRTQLGAAREQLTAMTDVLAEQERAVAATPSE